MNNVLLLTENFNMLIVICFIHSDTLLDIAKQNSLNAKYFIIYNAMNINGDK